MTRVYVGIGSNIDRERNVRSGVRALRAAFGTLILSEVYESQAVGFEGASFLNLVAGFDTVLAPRDLVAALRAIETQHRRDRAPARYGSRTLDIDLLLYGDLVSDEPGLRLPRADVASYEFVLRPLAEIAPDERHPVTGAGFARMWQDYRRDGSAITVVPDFFAPMEDDR